MKPISDKCRRFPPDVIGHAVRLYFRIAPSFRDVEELLAERGLAVSFETIQGWTLKFGARQLGFPATDDAGHHRLSEIDVLLLVIAGFAVQDGRSDPPCPSCRYLPGRPA